MKNKEWNPMSTAPKDGTKILVYYSNLDDEMLYAAVSWHKISSKRDENLYGWIIHTYFEDDYGYYPEVENPLCWMLLPEIPKIN